MTVTSGAAPKAQDAGRTREPGEAVGGERGLAVPDRERVPVQGQHRVRVGRLGLDGQAGPGRWLGQPGPHAAAGRWSHSRWPGSRTAAGRRTRAAAPGSHRGPGWRGRTAATSGPGGAHREGLRPPTGRAPRPGTRRRCRAATATAAPRRGPAGCPGPGRWARRCAGGAVERGVGPPVAGDVPDHVVVAEDPGGRGADLACEASVASMTDRSSAPSHGQRRKSKLNTVCSSPGRR